jgi:hypothetical protein
MKVALLFPAVLVVALVVTPAALLRVLELLVKETRVAANKETGRAAVAVAQPQLLEQELAALE